MWRPVGGSQLAAAAAEGKVPAESSPFSSFIPDLLFLLLGPGEKVTMTQHIPRSAVALLTHLLPGLGCN